MKIIYLRHGESVDDLTNQYGGWADFPLTPTGVRQARSVAERIKNLGIKIDHIVHSPLKRAKEVASILGTEFCTPVYESVWLKEKNGYGLLSGIEKENAKELYPDLCEMMNNGYVYGAEPEEMFQKRVLEYHKNLSNQNKNILAVTHGGFLSRLVDNYLDKKYLNAHDCGFIVVDTDSQMITYSDGFDFK